MKTWVWLIATALVLTLVGPADAGKRKGAVTARLEYGVARKLKGLSIEVALTNHKERADGGVVGAFTMTVRKGKSKKAIDSGWVDAPWFEVVAFKHLVQVRGGINDVAVTVAPATRLARRAISDERAIELVSAEADRRGIGHDGGGSSSGGNGVIFVSLTQGDVVVVDAVIGARSRDLLAFEVTDAAATVGQTDPPDPPATEPPARTAPVASSASQVILDEHNRYRADHCAPALTWSDKLAAVAQAWADQLRDAGCAFEHSSTKYGENLAAGTTGSLSPAEVVAMWYREVDAYDFDGGGFSMETGHFTQVVWKGTSKLGCGVAQCGGMDLWVCNYDAPGNMDGAFRKNVLATSCR